MDKKLRVWWMPQVDTGKTFYVPVQSVEEGKKVMDFLAVYDAFQLQNHIKPDYCNTGGLEMFNKEENKWEEWYLETKDDYFDEVDEYCDQCERAMELEEFSKELFKQIDWEKINNNIK